MAHNHDQENDQAHTHTCCCPSEETTAEDDKTEEAGIEETGPEQEVRVEDSARPVTDNPPAPTDGS